MILHLSHIFLTEGRTFIMLPFGYAYLISIRSRFNALTLFGANGLLETVSNSAAVKVIDRKLYRYFVTRQNLDVMHTHFA